MVSFGCLYTIHNEMGAGKCPQVQRQREYWCVKRKNAWEISAQAFFMSLLNKTVLWHRRNARVMKGISSNLFQKQYNWKGWQDCYRDWHGGIQLELSIERTIQENDMRCQEC